MNEIELMAKLENELPLTTEEQTWLDSKLSVQSGSVMLELPEESVSLAWRSQLNERLIAMQPKAKRRPWLFAGGLTATVAGSMLMLTLMRTPTVTVVPTGSIESDIVASHELMVQQASAGLFVSTGDNSIDADVLEWVEGQDDSL